MKNRALFFIFGTILCFTVFMTGCSNDLLTDCKTKLSDIRENYFQGQTENWFVSFSSGIRESPYKLDGVSNEKVEFGVVTIMPKNIQSTKSLKYVVSVDGVEYCGDFESSPFDDSYAGDIEIKVTNDATIFVKIKDGASEEIANLECKSCDFSIDYNKALSLAVNEIKNNATNKINKEYEVYVKIIADITQKIDEKYWLITFLSSDGDIMNILINPYTGQCEQKNV